jgi:xylan 1,4-beta-xylosidase
VNPKRIVAVLLLMVGLSCAQTGTSQTKTCNVEVDFSRAEGTIRHLNDVNGGPLCQRGYVDLSSYYKELGIKYVRLADVPWTFDNAQNLNYVFPRFDADPDQPDSYDFLQTDWYLKSIKDLGIEIIYELGPTAEKPKGPLRNVDPPKDFEKWAKICVNLIKHYNSGWANGYRYDIKYWEIWNEPDVGKGVWTGTPEQYYRLYEVTAKAIKNYDPNVKVGGPVLADDMPFLEGFLEYCKNHKLPLDFVAWHIYSAKPSAIALKAAKVRELMNKYGFPNAESVLDEWNYFPGSWDAAKPTDVNADLGDPRYANSVAREIQGVNGAAFDAAVLILLQDSSVNIANFYHGNTNVLLGLFNEHGVPEKNYYTFNAFKSLLETPERVVTGNSDESGLAAIAGLSHDKTQATVLISNFGTACSRYNIRLNNLPWKEGFIYEKYDLDEKHDIDLVKTETLFGTNAILPDDVKVPSVSMIRLKAAEVK